MKTQSETETQPEEEPSAHQKKKRQKKSTKATSERLCRIILQNGKTHFSTRASPRAWMGWSSCNSPPLSPSPERPNVDIRAPILQSDEPSAANKLENDEAEKIDDLWKLAFCEDCQEILPDGTLHMATEAEGPFCVDPLRIGCKHRPVAMCDNCGRHCCHFCAYIFQDWCICVECDCIVATPHGQLVD